MTIIRLSVENARRRYYEAMGETNKLMEKWSIFERDKHPEWKRATRKEARLLQKWQELAHGT